MKTKMADDIKPGDVWVEPTSYSNGKARKVNRRLRLDAVEERGPTIVRFKATDLETGEQETVDLFRVNMRDVEERRRFEALDVVEVALADPGQPRLLGTVVEERPAGMVLVCFRDEPGSQLVHYTQVSLWKPKE